MKVFKLLSALWNALRSRCGLGQGVSQKQLQAELAQTRVSLACEKALHARDNKRLLAEVELHYTRCQVFEASIRQMAQTVVNAQPAQPPVTPRMTQYAQARVAATIFPVLQELIENLELGVYRRGQQLMFAHTPLAEEQIAEGWELLNLQESRQQITEKARVAVAVWN